MRRRQAVDRARQHLLRAAAAGNQADADFDQADVALGRRLHAVAVQRDLAAAAERQPGGRDDDRHVGVAQRQRRALERADHQVDLVPVAFLRFEQQQHQVGAGGEVRRVVADDERREVRGGFLDAGVQHLDRVAADRVHLRVELDARARRRRGRPGWRRRSAGRRAADPWRTARICRSGAAGGTPSSRKRSPA